MGLGNPTKTYEKTRHNAGFWVLNELARRNSVKFVANPKMQGSLAQLCFSGEKIQLLKPMTFMNDSGRSVGLAAHYFKIPPQNLLVVHDELDFEPGITRFKKDGGHGGHNGLRSIITHLNSSQFCRIRIGIGRPDAGREVTSYVLNRPSAREEIEMQVGISKVVDLIPDLVKGDYQSFMNRVHTD